MSAPYARLEGNSIRVLVLDPGEPGDQLSGALDVVDLDEAIEPYDAISYTWGRAVFPEELSLGHVKLKITSSLWHALRRVRSRTKAVRLWTDAVCINQSDVAERNSQVALMAEIFNTASAVNVWLGEASEDDTLAFWTIQALYEVWENGIETLPSWTDVACTFASMFASRDCTCSCCGLQAGRYEGDDSLIESLAALLKLLGRPYWGRLWVVQEISSKRGDDVRFFCGSHHVTRATLDEAVLLCDAIVSYYDGPPLKQPLRPSTPVFATFLHLQYCPEHLLRTLLATRDLACAEPRDRLYGVLAMTDVDHSAALEPNYDIDLDELWIRTTAYILANPLELEHHKADKKQSPDSSLVLAVAGLQNDGDTSPPLPSWVPRYNRLSREARDKQRFHERVCMKRSTRRPLAGGPEIFRGQRDRLHPNLLHLRGKLVDRIWTILPDSQFRNRETPSPTDREYWAYVKTVLIPWYTRCKTFFSETCWPSKTWLGDLGYIMRQGAYTKYEREYGSPSYDSFLENCRSCGKEDGTGNPIGKTAYVALKPFLSWTVTHGYYLDRTRLLGCTERRRPCWVPRSARLGDEVWLFEGAAFPFVLRRQENGRFEVVGDAFVYGVMNGEAWASSESEVEDVVMQ